jgi:hypothetical protein
MEKTRVRMTRMRMTPVRMARVRILRSVRLLTLAGSLLAGCGSTSHVDMYFGTDAGADFTQPEREAGVVSDAAADGGVD